MRHDLIDKRSLDLNRLIVKKIRQQPERMAVVRNNLMRALEDARLSDSCKAALGEWEELFHNCSEDKLLDLLVEESEQGQRLRQSTPFWGILTTQERRSIFREYEPAQSLSILSRQRLGSPGRRNLSLLAASPFWESIRMHQGP